MEVTGLLLLPVSKADCKTFCPMSRIGPVTVRPAPQWGNIQSTLRTAPDLCQNVSLQCYMVGTVIHIQSVHSQICTYIHMFFTT